MLGQEVQLENIVEDPSNEYDDDEDYDNEENESGDDTTEEEPCFSSDGCYEPETDTDSASEREEDLDSSDNRYWYILCTCYDLIKWFWFLIPKWIIFNLPERVN